VVALLMNTSTGIVPMLNTIDQNLKVMQGKSPVAALPYLANTIQELFKLEVIVIETRRIVN
jgi:hypothetical protein